MSKIVTRFPPSPTGYLHIGRARTALFNYLFAKKYDGKMVFRLEDTDKERSKKEFEENIIDCLSWLKITYDEGPTRQSEHTTIYLKYLEKMVANGSAYVSKETEGEREEVIRFKNPNKKILFHDLIRGEIEFDTTELGDFVIARSMQEPLYHLAVVVDDFEMGVTHIIRGEDGISNTPRQILIQEAIGAPRPLYAHLPLILAADRSKLSGRHGAVAVSEYRNMGYLPEALVNYLALVGWNPGTEQEIFNMEELIEAFDIAQVNKAGAIFDLEKLKWINKQYLKREEKREEYLAVIKKKIQAYRPVSDDILSKAAPLVLERVSTFGEADEILASGEFDFLFSKPEYETEKLLWKDEKDLQVTKMHVEEVIKMMDTIAPSSFDPDSIKDAVWHYATEKGRGNVLWPVRFALSGKEKSPDPFTLAGILGKEETLKRLSLAKEKLGK